MPDPSSADREVVVARRLADPDYDRQTAIVDALPHACTVGRLEDWREATGAFLNRLHAAGYEVVKRDV